MLASNPPLVFCAASVSGVKRLPRWQCTPRISQSCTFSVFGRIHGETIKMHGRPRGMLLDHTYAGFKPNRCKTYYIILEQQLSSTILLQGVHRTECVRTTDGKPSTSRRAVLFPSLVSVLVGPAIGLVWAAAAANTLAVVVRAAATPALEEAGSLLARVLVHPLQRR